MTPGFDGECFRGREVLITGGLGFIGSNLAIALVDLGAHVTLLDAMLDEHGGNLFNIEPVKERVAVNFSDARDESSLKYLVRGKDYIFHLAGQNDHVLSLSNPFPDIDINIKGSAMLLETCKRVNPSARPPGTAIASTSYARPAARRCCDASPTSRSVPACTILRLSISSLRIDGSGTTSATSRRRRRPVGKCRRFPSTPN